MYKLECKDIHNSYLSHHFVDSFSRILKMKNANTKTSFVTPEAPNVVILVNILILQNQCKTKIADYLFLFLKNEVKRK